MRKGNTAFRGLNFKPLSVMRSLSRSIPGLVKLNTYYFDVNVRDEGDEHIPEGSTILAMLVASRYNVDFAILLVVEAKAW
jgi:hypothetical protein